MPHCPHWQSPQHKGGRGSARCHQGHCRRVARQGQKGWGPWPPTSGSRHYTSASQCLAVGKRKEDGEDVDNGPPEGFGRWDLWGSVLEKLPGRGKKEKNPPFRWLEICLAGDDRDFILPVCTEEGLSSQGCCRDLGKVPFAANGDFVPHPRQGKGTLLARGEKSLAGTGYLPWTPCCWCGRWCAGERQCSNRDNPRATQGTILPREHLPDVLSPPRCSVPRSQGFAWQQSILKAKDREQRKPAGQPRGEGRATCPSSPCSLPG